MKRLPLWQPQIGLFKINRKCRKSCREQLHDTANLFVEEVINDTSNPLQVCITITFLLLILNCVGRKSDRKQQIHHLKMLSNPKDDYLYIKVVVTTVVVIASTMVKSSSFVILLILLLIAGDVETNPGPFTTGITLRAVWNELFPVRFKWYNVGLELNISHTKLNELREQYPQSELMREMLNYWMCTETLPTWRVIVNALESQTVAEIGLAAKIERKYCNLGDENVESTTDLKPDDSDGVKKSTQEGNDRTVLSSQPIGSGTSTVPFQHAVQNFSHSVPMQQMPQQLPQQMPQQMPQPMLFTQPMLMHQPMLFPPPMVMPQMTQPVLIHQPMPMAFPQFGHGEHQFCMKDTPKQAEAPATIPSECTGTLTVKNISSELKSVSRWYQLGVQLGLDLSRLKDIEQTTGDSQRHRLEMVELWLQSTPGASWEDLVEALRGIDELVQAERINSKYIKRQRELEEVEAFIKKLTEHIGIDWKALARELGLSKTDIDAIDHDKAYLRDKISHLFQKWRQQEGRDASILKLVNGMKAAKLEEQLKIMQETEFLQEDLINFGECTSAQDLQMREGDISTSSSPNPVAAPTTLSTCGPQLEDASQDKQPCLLPTAGINRYNSIEETELRHQLDLFSRPEGMELLTQLALTKSELQTTKQENQKLRFQLNAHQHDIIQENTQEIQLHSNEQWIEQQGGTLPRQGGPYIQLMPDSEEANFEPMTYTHTPYPSLVSSSTTFSLSVEESYQQPRVLSHDEHCPFSTANQNPYNLSFDEDEEELQQRIDPSLRAEGQDVLVQLAQREMQLQSKEQEICLPREGSPYNTQTQPVMASAEANDEPVIYTHSYQSTLVSLSSASSTTPSISRHYFNHHTFLPDSLLSAISRDPPGQQPYQQPRPVSHQENLFPTPNSQPYSLSFDPSDEDEEEEELHQRMDPSLRAERQDILVQLGQREMQLQSKEQEIEQLRGQLSEAQRQSEGLLSERVGEVELYVANIRELENLLKTKNTQVEDLRQELQCFRDEVQALRAARPINPDELYKMDKNPHGICLIINNYEFYHPTDPNKAHNDRGGANIDQFNLIQTFRYLRYKVEVKENLTADEMADTLFKMSQRDHSNYDSFVCCILTHGERDIVHGADSIPVSLFDLTGILKFCKGLAGKPKMFFIQACRGEQEDKGVAAEKDSGGSQPLPTITIPQEADFFFGYATPSGNAAYRSRRHGSWYISELCKVFTQNAYHGNLSSMMKKVNFQVSKAFTKEGLKQCSEYVDRLRSEVHFFHFIRPKPKP